MYLLYFPYKIIHLYFFFSVHEQVEFNKSCNLIGSGRGWNFPIRPSLGGRSQHLLKNVSILSGNLLNDLCYYVSKNLSVKPLSSTYCLCFHHYLCLEYHPWPVASGGILKSSATVFPNTDLPAGE